MADVRGGMRRLEPAMSPWQWVLIGLAAWLAPALVAALMFAWGILRPPRAGVAPEALQAAQEPAGPGQPLQEAQLSQQGEPPPGGEAA